jgi:cation diffusion facilitator CzcD-associated flavoprotein CzcO
VFEVSDAIPTPIDVAVIGGGQAGLATGYYLRRTGRSFVILDAENGPGAAWQHTWPSLHLFSPARWSSLPGWLLSGGESTYPSRDQFLAYLAAYEERYRLPIRRPVWVGSVARSGDRLALETTAGTIEAWAVVSATGTWRHPVVPHYPDQECFRGEQLHSARYGGPAPFAGQRVLIVGGGNSGAQILADVSRVAETVWATRRPPTFLPDDVDGRVLFDRATERYLAHVKGEGSSAAQRRREEVRGLGSVVMVPSVREARERGVLHSAGMFERFTETGVVWPDGSETAIDTVIWCTGFGPALEHLRPLGVITPGGHVAVNGTRSVVEPRLWLVGYGQWTGYASATIIGVGRTARSTAQEVDAFLGGEGSD